MVKSKLDVEAKELAVAILAKQGIDHNDWMNQKYSEVISSNSKILINCLKNSGNKGGI